MISNIVIYLKDGGIVTWLYEVGAIMQCLRVRYPELTIVRLSDQTYVASFSDRNDTFMGKPRHIAESVLGLDDNIERIDWSDLEELV